MWSTTIRNIDELTMSQTSAKSVLTRNLRHRTIVLDQSGRSVSKPVLAVRTRKHQVRVPVSLQSFAVESIPPTNVVRNNMAETEDTAIVEPEPLSSTATFVDNSAVLEASPNVTLLPQLPMIEERNVDTVHSDMNDQPSSLKSLAAPEMTNQIYEQLNRIVLGNNTSDDELSTLIDNIETSTRMCNERFTALSEMNSLQYRRITDTLFREYAKRNSIAQTCANKINSYRTNKKTADQFENTPLKAAMSRSMGINAQAAKRLAQELTKPWSSELDRLVAQPWNFKPMPNIETVIGSQEIMTEIYNKSEKCGICMGTKPNHEMYGLNCSHTVCHTCMDSMNQCKKERMIKCPYCRVVIKTISHIVKKQERLSFVIHDISNY